MSETYDHPSMLEAAKLASANIREHFAKTIAEIEGAGQSGFRLRRAPGGLVTGYIATWPDGHEQGFVALSANNAEIAHDLDAYHGARK